MKKNQIVKKSQAKRKSAVTANKLHQVFTL